MCRRAAHLGFVEKIVLFFGMGVISGTIGINYSHELMHQKIAAGTLAGRPAAGDGAVRPFPHRTSAGASPVCRHPARSGDGALQRRLPPLLSARAAWTARRSAWRAETAMLARKGLPALAPSQSVLALCGAASWRCSRWRSLLGGWVGLVLFLWQAWSRSGSWSW